jgi:hypothetical protein
LFVLLCDIYADDVVLFLGPAAADNNTTMENLQLFGEASGLRTNIQKSSIAPTRCSTTDIEIIEGYLPY